MTTWPTTREGDETAEHAGALALRPAVRVIILRSVGAVLAMAAILPGLGVHAATATASLQVSAEVLPHARLESDANRTVQVTPGDVARGYLEVHRRYRLSTNAPDRALLQLQPRVGLTRAVDVMGLAAPVRLFDTNLDVIPPTAAVFNLSFRLWLAPEAVPGEYSMPVHVAAVVR